MISSRLARHGLTFACMALTCVAAAAQSAVPGTAPGASAYIDMADRLLPTAMLARGQTDVLVGLQGTRINRDFTLVNIGLNATDHIHDNELITTVRHGLTPRLMVLGSMLAGNVRTTSTAANGASNHTKTEGLLSAQVGLRYDVLPRDGRDEALTVGALINRRAQHGAPSVALTCALDVVGSTRLMDDLRGYAGLRLSLPGESSGNRQVTTALGVQLRQDEDMSYRAELGLRRDMANSTVQGSTQQSLELGSIITVAERTLVSPSISVARWLATGKKDGSVRSIGAHGLSLGVNVYHLY